MPLNAGSRLGPYEILAPLGAGGMGEVYRARDTRLGREVAVKVLPASLILAEQARQRFEREARTISQLSHPHICALYDVGREGETEFLVMELLDGQTLAERLSKGPLPLDQALRYGAEIADALDRAHRQGIVHRDLKPGNVMLTASGAKVLDFGLARATAGSAAADSLTGLPTETPLTEAGTVLGTVQYMAPEQLEGKEADARTDIHALGLVLFEMATGRQAFSAATRASLIGAILRDEPQPVSKDQPLAPRALDRVVAVCLAKEPEERWQTARDVSLQLEGIRRDRSASEPTLLAPGRARRASATLPWAVAAAAIAFAVFALLRGSRPASRPQVMRTLVLPPPGTTFNYGPNSAPVTVSPDGRRLAFGARDSDGLTRLWIRDLEASEPYLLPGGEGALFPFWSPDSRYLGFFSRGALKVIEASPSPQPPRVLTTDIFEARGGTWGEDGTILYSPGNLGSLMKVSSSGGKPVPATKLAEGERAHRWPRFLPGGRRYLYEVRRPSPGGSTPGGREIYLASLDSSERRLILSNDASATYVSPGLLIFARVSNLMAVACDPKTLEIQGEPTILAPGVATYTAPGSPIYSVSENLLVYSPRAGTSPTRMAVLDRSGREVASVGAAGNYLSFGVSADGRAVVASRMEDPLPPDLWLFDPAGRGIRLTRDADPQLLPVASPDGQRIFCAAYARGPWDIWETTSRGGTDLKPFLESDSIKSPLDVSPDGRWLLYRDFSPATLGDLKVVPLTDERKPVTFVSTADDESSGDFSPDGRWIAYSSDESGRKEIYAASFPGAARRIRVTTEGGSQPRWSRDGKELFYLKAGRLVAVPVVRMGDDLTFGQSQPLFALPLFAWGDTGFDVSTRYDVLPDGRFIALLTPGEQAPDPVVVMLHWAEALKKP